VSKGEGGYATQQIPRPRVLTEKLGVGPERVGETDEEGRSAVESDHRVGGADLHRVGNFISGDARQALCWFVVS